MILFVGKSANQNEDGMMNDNHNTKKKLNEQ